MPSTFLRYTSCAPVYVIQFSLQCVHCKNFKFVYAPLICSFFSKFWHARLGSACVDSRSVRLNIYQQRTDL